MMPRESFAFFDYQPQLDNLFTEVVTGLSHLPKHLPAKLFYDQRGSELFEEICRLEEYYLTRTELGILRRHAPEMASLLGDHCLLIEYGSGNSRKIRFLLDQLNHASAVYMPIDISKEHLKQAASQLAVCYPNLEIVAVCADYTRRLDLPPTRRQIRHKAVFFPGSTIGNFPPAEARTFLTNAAQMLSPGGRLVIGVDVKKDEAILNAAYNDARGVTAEFNLNMLNRLNRELKTDFDLNAFAHHAFYNATRGCIEMHLVSQKSQTVHLAEHSFRFEAGESIHSEDSFKYSIPEFEALAQEVGFEPLRVWTDDNKLFSVFCLQAI